jgi:thiol-disulfide isomerase/thioredoxin
MRTFLIPECGSCDAFAPHLKRLEIMKRKDLAIVGISWASRREIHTYVKKRLGKYPILQDPRRAYSNRYIGRVVKFPYLAVLDRQGKLSWFGRGKFHAQVTREVDRAIGGAPAMPKDKPEKSYALLFGAGKTEHGIALRCPANDIALLDKTLKPRFTEVKTLLPCDEKGKSPTLAQVKEALKEMAEKAGEKDLLFCYYSGDGTPVTVDVQKKDLKLQLSDGQITMSEIHAILKESKAGYRFFSLDIGQDGDGRSALEDIADEVEAHLPDLPILLSAARYDKSAILYGCKDGKSHTLYCSELAKHLGSACSPYSLFRNVRDGMSIWSRQTGRLQSPFILSRKSKYAAFHLEPLKPEEVKTSKD